MESPPPPLQLSTGALMPAVGFGCAGRLRKPVLLNAIEAGYTLFDTAQAKEWYLESELGDAIAESRVNRSSLFITTKIHPRDLGEARTLAALPRSLRALRTSYVDALLLHYPRCFGDLCAERPEGTWRESWRALEALHAQGSARAIGVSNFGEAELTELLAFATVRSPTHHHSATARLLSLLPQPPLLLSAQTAPRPVMDGSAPPNARASPNLRRLGRRVPIVLVPRHTGIPNSDHGTAAPTHHTLTCVLRRAVRAQHRTRVNPVLRHPVIKEIAAAVGRSEAQVTPVALHRSDRTHPDREHAATWQVVLRWAVQSGAAVIPRSSRRPQLALRLFECHHASHDCDLAAPAQARAHGRQPASRRLQT